jgi:hypothetical protein
MVRCLGHLGCVSSELVLCLVLHPLLLWLCDKKCSVLQLELLRAARRRAVEGVSRRSTTLIQVLK